MSKQTYKPERQPITETIYFCHGKSALGHSDVIMKSLKVLEGEAYLAQDKEKFLNPFIYLRPATEKEVKLYCKHST